MASEAIFSVLYTHQKTKKAKTWQDGVLKVQPSANRATLYDEKNCKLDSLYVKIQQVYPGEQLESDRYLIEVEEQKSTCASLDVTSQPPQRGPVVSTVLPPRPGPLIQSQAPRIGLNTPSTVPLPRPGIITQSQAPRVGLKRRRAGFVPPRLVRPKIQDPVVQEPISDPQTSKSSAPVLSLNSNVAAENRNALFNMYKRPASQNIINENQDPRNPKRHHCEESNGGPTTTSFETSSIPIKTNLMEHSVHVASISRVLNSIGESNTERPSPWSVVGHKAGGSMSSSSSSTPANSPHWKNPFFSQAVTVDQGSKSELPVCEYEKIDKQDTNCITVPTKRSTSQILALIGKSGYVKPRMSKSGVVTDENTVSPVELLHDDVEDRYLIEAEEQQSICSNVTSRTSKACVVPDKNTVSPVEPLYHNVEDSSLIQVEEQKSICSDVTGTGWPQQHDEPLHDGIVEELTAPFSPSDSFVVENVSHVPGNNNVECCADSSLIVGGVSHRNQVTQNVNSGPHSELDSDVWKATTSETCITDDHHQKLDNENIITMNGSSNPTMFQDTCTKIAQTNLCEDSKMCSNPGVESLSQSSNCPGHFLITEPSLLLTPGSHDESGCFAISFSPLSHDSLSDSEDLVISGIEVSSTKSDVEEMAKVSQGLSQSDKSVFIDSMPVINDQEDIHSTIAKGITEVKEKVFIDEIDKDKLLHEFNKTDSCSANQLSDQSRVDTKLVNFVPPETLRCAESPRKQLESAIDGPCIKSAPSCFAPIVTSGLDSDEDIDDAVVYAGLADLKWSLESQNSLHQIRIPESDIQSTPKNYTVISDNVTADSISSTSLIDDKNTSPEQVESSCTTCWSSDTVSGDQSTQDSTLSEQIELQGDLTVFNKCQQPESVDNNRRPAGSGIEREDRMTRDYHASWSENMANMDTELRSSQLSSSSPWGACFLTDQRSVSRTPGIPSRRSAQVNQTRLESNASDNQLQPLSLTSLPHPSQMRGGRALGYSVLREATKTASDIASVVNSRIGSLKLPGASSSTVRRTAQPPPLPKDLPSPLSRDLPAPVNGPERGPCGAPQLDWTSVRVTRRQHKAPNTPEMKSSREDCSIYYCDPNSKADSILIQRHPSYPSPSLLSSPDVNMSPQQMVPFTVQAPVFLDMPSKAANQHVPQDITTASLPTGPVLGATTNPSDHTVANVSETTTGAPAVEVKRCFQTPMRSGPDDDLADDSLPLYDRVVPDHEDSSCSLAVYSVAGLEFDTPKPSKQLPVWMQAQDSCEDLSFSFSSSPFVAQQPRSDNIVSSRDKLRPLRAIHQPNQTYQKQTYMKRNVITSGIPALVSDAPQSENTDPDCSKSISESKWNKFTDCDGTSSRGGSGFPRSSVGIDHLVPCPAPLPQAELELHSDVTSGDWSDTEEALLNAFSEDSEFEVSQQAGIPDSHAASNVGEENPFYDSPDMSNTNISNMCSRSREINQVSDIGKLTGSGDVAMRGRGAAGAVKQDFKAHRVPGGGNGLARTHSRPLHEISETNSGQLCRTFRPPLTASRSLTSVDALGDLCFPCRQTVENQVRPSRQATIPTTFPSPKEYRCTLAAALREHLNIQLFELAKTFHSSLSKVDISQYHTGSHGSASTGHGNSNPVCQHNTPSKIVEVKKAGPNKGRLFFACSAAREEQCKFFQWADQSGKSAGGGGRASAQPQSLQLSDVTSITAYMKSQKVALYCECRLIRKVPDSYKPHMKNMPPWVRKGFQDENQQKKLYIKLSRKEISSFYTKDDIWVVSSSLSFDRGQTFVARSMFYGPTGNSEIELDPISGYSPSNWQNDMLCCAIHAGNASSELMCLSNLEMFVQPATLPILPSLLSRDQEQIEMVGRTKFNTPSHQTSGRIFYAPWEFIEEEVASFVQEFGLNKDQATSLRNIASQFNEDNPADMLTITLVHGVFGSGKSYLLSVVVLFLLKVFELSASYTPGLPEPLKVLISSTTNVAVDRILLGLLSLGFENFIRVGSVKKIAKPILPYSVHSTGTENQELKDLQEMMRSDISTAEKLHVRKTIDKLRKGENKKRLTQVQVVGATCAACVFQSLQELKFAVVLLDECSQMTEPTSLLPVARFGCHRLVLVGDPKQLSPTLQGSDSAHEEGLDQTLFDRLSDMGHVSTLLRMQYRCHPKISAIANTLFYENKLIDGVSAAERPPIVLDWPTLCFFDLPAGAEAVQSGGSYYNTAEAQFVVAVLEILAAQGTEASAVGVITLYRAQQAHISLLLKQSRFAGELSCVQVSTVDAFQGGERDIILLSCVRTKQGGFIDCLKRTNVALTRARNHLFILGHKRNLLSNKLWAKIIGHCEGLGDGVHSGQQFVQHYTALAAADDGNTPPSPDHSRSTTTDLSPDHSQSTTTDLSPDCPPIESSSANHRKKKVLKVRTNARGTPSLDDQQDFTRGTISEIHQSEKDNHLESELDSNSYIAPEVKRRKSRHSHILHDSDFEDSCVKGGEDDDDEDFDLPAVL